MSNPPPSALVRYGGFSLFLAMMLGAGLWFCWSFIGLIADLATESSVIAFNKGAMYMLGVCVGLLALIVAIFIEVILRRSLTPSSAKTITRIAYTGIGLMVLFPQAIHYPLQNHLLNKQYEICDASSYQWLLYREIVFTKGEGACRNLSSAR